MKDRAFARKWSSDYGDAVLHIALLTRGGLGDQFFIIKYAYCLRRYLGGRAGIDIYFQEDGSEELAAIFSQQDMVSEVFVGMPQKQYDVELSMDRFPEVRGYDEARLAALGQGRMLEYLKGIERFQMERREFYESDYLGMAYTKAQGRTREDQADVEGWLQMQNLQRFKIELQMEDEAVREKFGVKRDFVLLQVGAGRKFRDTPHDTRQWPLPHYEEIIRCIKRERPELQIIQLGAAYHVPVAGVDLYLLGETLLVEALALLRAARLLIAPESGYPIMRYFVSGKVSCVMFGPTERDFYGLPGNINLFSGACPGCEIWPEWYKTCLRHDVEPRCMATITPEMVYEHIRLYLV